MASQEATARLIRQLDALEEQAHEILDMRIPPTTRRELLRLVSEQRYALQQLRALLSAQEAPSVTALFGDQERCDEAYATYLRTRGPR